MKETFKFIIDSRNAFIRLLDELTLDELNQIPEGFNNNIIWNFGHIVVSTQTLCYVRTGIRSDTSTVKYLDAYKKGSKPAYFVSIEEVNELKQLAISTIQKLQEDYQTGIFEKIVPFDTSTFGVLINNIEELLITTVGHDNTHFGYAIAQRRIIKK
ncbi:DinB family protein [Sphingobacterium corticibacterium]|uniref:DinB family protein n=1 Tax=Sphingobacterium corticibacterium TaxID=2484746 RepID=A0A4V2DC17_9SPHI|nr:DinB family protein [Sphingobacterium corticibacterium]RZF59928.1 DinB family protein [Sphingobacterium corticibacterium]